MNWLLSKLNISPSWAGILSASDNTGSERREREWTLSCWVIVSVSISPITGRDNYSFPLSEPVSTHLLNGDAVQQALLRALRVKESKLLFFLSHSSSIGTFYSHGVHVLFIFPSCPFNLPIFLYLNPSIKFFLFK